MIDLWAGVIMGSIITLVIVGSSICLWYTETTDGWDHKPTHDEISQKIIESYILEDRD